MRHRKKKNYLGNTLGHRKALMAQLATSLILHESINTTFAKAKTIRPYTERLITLSKKDCPVSRRKADAKLAHKNAVKKLFEVIGPKYKNRGGGYVRIKKLSRRGGDNSQMAEISLV